MTKQAAKYFFHSRFFITISILSLALNIIVAALYISAAVIVDNGDLDNAQISSATALMCSDEYRYKYEHTQTSPGDLGKKQMALLNYSCAKQGAGPYFEKGYNEYIKSLGLEP